jgi:threonine/homoserine efflux transporter RhtA
VSHRETAVKNRAKELSLILVVSAGTLALGGCRSAPLFNLMGSFFPAWMLCLVAGILLTLVARWFFQRIDFERDLRPLVLIYPALVAFFTCTLWLLMFS